MVSSVLRKEEMLAKFSNDTWMKVSSFHPLFQDKARMEGMEWVEMGWHLALYLATLRFR